MNRYANNIILEFSSNENKEYLHTKIINYFNNNPTVFRFLAKNFDDLVSNYVATIQQELSLSDPLPGTSIYDQVNCFNNQFIDDRIHYIKTHVITGDNVPLYVVKDDLPTTRNNSSHYKKNPNKILDDWRRNSGRGVQARSDPSSDIYPNNPYNGDESTMHTGIVFCDQSEVGLQLHQDLYFNSLYSSLNDTPRPHERVPFGESTPESDARLLSRKTFRKNEAGDENGIPRYEARLYKRNLERDITEGLQNSERGCMVLAHDMSSLYSRIDYKNKVKVKYNSCDKKSNLKLQNNDSIPEDMRYS